MTGQPLRLNLFLSTKELFNFSLPIVFGQLGLMLIAAADVYVATQHGTLSAASLGVALGFINPILLLGLGMLMGVAPVLSIKRGRGEKPSKFFFSNLVYSLIVSFFMMILMLIVNEIIPYVGIEKEIVPYLQRYVFITVWSFPFACLFQVIKEHLQSFEKVLLANTIAILGVLVNLILNYGLVFGKWGFPQIGYDGLAYASLSIRFILAAFMLVFCLKALQSFKVHWDYIKEVARFSFPIAAMVFLEVLGFSFVSVVIGTIGVKESAANNIVLNLASLTFMVPLSISSAATVKVGLEYGKQSLVGITRFTFSSLILSTSFMCISCSIYMLFPEELMNHLSLDKTVIAIGVQLLFIVGLFQIIDGIQVTLAGILRGLEKTKESFYAIVIGYWVLGLPFGMYLTFYQDMKPQGLWIGLASSLTFVSISLSVITKKQLKTIKKAFRSLKN